MANTITALKKKYQGIRIQYPGIEVKDYKAVWQRLEALGRKIEKAWKNKKTALELVKEARR